MHFQIVVILICTFSYVDVMDLVACICVVKHIGFNVFVPSNSLVCLSVCH